MREQGIPMTPALLAAVRKRDAQGAKESRMEIWPDMAPAVILFFSLNTQWRRGFGGEVLGLDYSAIRPTADLLAVEFDQQAFLDLQEMEGEALRVIRSKRRV